MDEQHWIGQSLDRHNPVPLYQQLSEILASKIRQGEYKPGIQLPSENELINLFGVSRFVVRQTLTSLVREGLIFTEQGKGSFVAFPKIMKPLDILQSYQIGMKKANINVEVRIVSTSFITPPALIAEKMLLKPNAKVMKLERVAFQNELPVNLLISYVTFGSWGEEKLASFSGGSLYEYLANACGVTLNRSISEIEVIFAGEYESRMLNLARGTVLLQILGVSFEKSGMPVEYSRVVYPGSMFGFQFESYIPEASQNATPALLRHS